MRKESIDKTISVKNIIKYDMKIWSQKYTFIIFVILIFIYACYQSGFFKSIPCENGIVNGVSRSFIHISTTHLLANLAGIYILYRAEMQLGSSKFLRTFISILVISIVFECIYSLLFKVECSIGFSGVLFGFAAWSILTEKKLDYSLLGLLAVFIVGTSIKDSKASFCGHLCGFMAGITTAIYMGQVPKADIHKFSSF
jgi:membrane associated rhomboid family serine protease